MRTNHHHHHAPVGALFILALPLSIVLLGSARLIVWLVKRLVVRTPRPDVEQAASPTPTPMDDDAVNVLVKLGDSKQAARSLLSKAKARGQYDRLEKLIAAMLAIRAGG
jgi:hypothetical protein